MKLLGIICMLLFFLPTNNLHANEGDELSVLYRQAAINKDLKSYSAVCRYFYEWEVQPELLLIYADSIRQLAFQTKSVDCFIEYYSWNSEAFFMKGDFANGCALKRKALLLAERTGRKKYIADCAADMGYYFNVDTRYDSARYYLKQGMAISENVRDLADKYRAMLTNYASSFLLEGQTDSALVYTLKAKQRSVMDRDTAMMIENLNQLGTIYRRKKDLEECISNFEQALHLCEAQKNLKTVAYIYGNIATAYCDWDRSLEAVPFSRKAVEYALQMGNPQMVGICYINLGAIQISIPELRAEGIETLQKAIPILKEVNNKRRLCEAYGYLANACRNNGDYRIAVGYLNQLDTLAKEMKTDVERYGYFRTKAPFLQDSRRYAEAIECYLQITDMLQKGYRDPKDYEHYEHLAECYTALKENAKAYECLRKAYALRDSAYQIHYVDRLSDYSVKYRVKEKRLEIARLQQKELEHKQELLYRRIAFGSFSALFIILLLLLLYARQRQKVRLVELAQAAGEKERQFLALQKETEHRLTRKYIDGLESERARIATELHDDVCNSLLALEMNIRSFVQTDNKAIGEQLVLLKAARERLRNISHELMPPAFQYATIDEMLADYILHLVLPGQMKAEYQSTQGAKWESVSQEIGFEFYRIVQEAVSNAVKHSEASLIRVELSLNEDCLTVIIEDDGKGFDSGKKTSGVGLRTMWQRTGIIGGEMELKAVPQSGVYIKVSVSI